MILDILKKIISHPKDVIIVALLLVVGYMSWMNSHKNHGEQPSNVVLPKDVVSETIVSNNNIKTVTRDKNGLTVEKNQYQPSEGTVTVIKKKDGTEIINVKDKGFCHKAGLALVTDFKDVKAALDIKLAYWGRYSVGLGSSIDYPYVFASRHVDDLSGPLHLSNLELFAGYGRRYSNFQEGLVVGGIRLNF